MTLADLVKVILKLVEERKESGVGKWLPFLQHIIIAETSKRARGIPQDPVRERGVAPSKRHKTQGVCLCFILMHR